MLSWKRMNICWMPPVLHLISDIHRMFPYSSPSMYRRIARKNYLALAKAKRRSTKKIRTTIRKQLAFIRRDIGYLENFMQDGYAPTSKEIHLLLTIYKQYEQQQYMYQNKIYSVDNRIVSIAQPWIRPIVRGKTKAPVESGPKLGRPSLEKQSAKEKNQEYQDNTDRIDVER